MNEIGFGFLRLPQNEDKTIDYERLNPMVDRFLELGGRYFDTAYTYLDELSEEAIRKSLTERHERSSFVLSDKLPGFKFTSYEECRACFERQLQRCGVDYFDIYLLHGLNEENYQIARENGQFRLLRELKAEGKAGRIGFSYHDTPQLLDKILTEHPEVDVVLLQINYLDWNSKAIRAAECYDVAVKHAKQIMVMEPVKGGTLAKLPEKAENILRELRPDDSMARWAVRFAAGLEQVEVMLSGMGAIEQIEENMRPLEPLTEGERETLERCARIIRKDTAVACTGCSYCVGGCPRDIPIPEYFALYNEYRRNRNEDWKIQPAYDALAKKYKKASECIGCRTCDDLCPQRLSAAQYIAEVAATFDK
ncbi:MAG: aldo/keto reductase [Oscillospiraceae bacterium]|nr:aldo/keto reductase [Oscillospiraceae bacterium]